MAYINFNNNPKGIKTSDCSIRAIAKALDFSWDKVSKMMFDISLELKTSQIDTSVLKTLLKNCEKINVKYGKEKSKKRFKVRDIMNQKPKGTFVIRLANHITCVKDGDLYDIWDCSGKACYIIWKVN